MSFLAGYLDDSLRCRLEENGIAPIENTEMHLVKRGLFGLN